MAENQQGKSSGTTKAADKDAAASVAEVNAESRRIGEERRQLVHADNLEGETAQTLEEAHEKGYFGVKVDPEPNESYTLQGVTKEGK
jgi:hypothetical protein